MNLSEPLERKGASVNTYINMLQAAIQRQGIALAGTPLVDTYLEDGSLRCINHIEPLLRDYYYIYCQPGSKDALMFCDWLKFQIIDRKQ